jgi:hypothetical protein
LSRNFQLKWINDYHNKTADLVGPELKKQKKMKEYEWLMKQTKPIVREPQPTKPSVTCVATTAVKSISLTFMTVLIALLFI